MGVASSPGPDRPYPARRSIRSSFAVVVAVPVVCLVALWVVAVLAAPGGTAVRNALLSHGHTNLAEVALYAGGGLLIVLVAVVLMALFAGRVSRDVANLEVTARGLADEKLPQMMMRLRNEGPASGAEQVTLRLQPRTAEIARAADAIADLQQTAIAAASDEASLRNGVAQVFVSLARRNQSLLQRQLRLIDTLERKAADPAALADLFLLDHLTTRMRRHAENLIILSGANPGRSWSAPVPVIDVIRGAAAEVEDYQRIRVITRSQDTVTGSAVADLIHLLAELVENAALFSPSDTRVDVRAERVANGFVVEIEDRGLGIQPDLLRQINHQLVNPPDFALADPDRLGLFVVAKLAARHSIRVTLSASPYGGSTAVALIPHTVVMPAPELGLDMRASAGELTAEPDSRSSDTFVLTGRTTAAWSSPPDDLAELTGRADADQLTGPGSTGPIGTVSPIGLAASASASRSLDLDASFDAAGPAGGYERGPVAPAAADATVIAGSPGQAGLPHRGGPLNSAGQPPAQPGQPFGRASQPPIQASRPMAAEPPTMGNSPAFPDLPTLGDPGLSRSAGSAGPGRESAFGGLPARGGSRPVTDGPPDRDVFGSNRDPFTPSRGGPASLPARGDAFTPSGLPSRGGSLTPGAPGGLDGPAPAAPGGRGQPARSASAGTYRGLPRRVRQANLSPHLAGGPAEETNPEPTLSAAPVPIPDRTPEEARAFVASFRTGWQRDEDTDDNGPRNENRTDTLGVPDGNGARATEQQDSAASPTEER